MITISLDEYGHFEGNDVGSEPAFIAGVIYDDLGISGDCLNERKRIEAYYRKVIETASDGSDEFEYPKALHSNGDKLRDSTVIASVKQTVSDTIGEFLTEGTFNGAELLPDKSQRQGLYYIFVTVKSCNGMNALTGDDVNILLRDEYASNLYFHMANQVISRVLFHNPLIKDIKSISLNIATRRSDDMPVDSLRVREYVSQGYVAEMKNNDETVHFGIANADIYRGVLSQEMIRAQKNKVTIESFEVRPINYRKSKGMEFMYLADSVCSYLGYRLNKNGSGSYLTKIFNKASRINERNRNLVFAYDEIDEYYRRALEAYERGDIYSALETVFDATRVKGEFAAFYNNTWFKHLVGEISKSESEIALIEAIEKIHRMVKTNVVDQDKSVYILNVLERIAVSVEQRMDDAESRAVMYKFYDAGISYYSHIGDSPKAIGYYNKCKKYAYRVGIEEYLTTLNRVIVSYLDSFEWDKARKAAEDNVACNEKLNEMKKEIPILQGNSQRSLGLSKAISQLAQVYAFLRDPMCEELFRKSLSYFEPDSADYKITQSYLLHYYLDNGLKDEYERESVLYFGGETEPDAQLDYLLQEGFKETPVLSYKYALYVFVRGLYLFKKDEISAQLRKRLFSIDKTIREAEIAQKGEKNSKIVKLTGHPTELIMKYLALMAKESGDKNKWNYFYSEITSKERLRYVGFTIELIQLFARTECRHIAGDFLERDRLLRKYMDQAAKHFRFFSCMKYPPGDEEKYLMIRDLMTFMYR